VGPGRDPENLRSLPAVHELAAVVDAPHSVAVGAARRAIREARQALLAGGKPAGDLAERARELALQTGRPAPRRVINASGVIVHTNLGRAPLAGSAVDAVTSAATGYSNLELDLVEGARGSRHAHVESLLCELTGAEAAIAVNNGAAAVLLASTALAGRGQAVVVSRGQLVEIGGGFRIPEVIAQSGARLVEVGTTNRTRLADFQRALSSDEYEVGAILRVHQSNFRTVGFVEEVSIERLVSLGPPVIDDAGSGVLSEEIGIPALGDEPSLRRSVAAGAALVCCSGDKLLGGPQAGLLVGRREAVAAAREHPLARAMRIDKLSLAALAATLGLYRDPELARREIPVLAMLEAGEASLAARAERLAEGIGEVAAIVPSLGRVGGGALPLLELEGPSVALDPGAADPVALARALRASDPPVIGRIHDGQLLLDPRTIADEEVRLVVDAVAGALAALGAG
jgi:L-seryl-tRNA(Ser) seleniumtransferase